MNSHKSLQAKIDWPAVGNYVVAVSGGADSVTLLDLLVRHSQGDYTLVVAHYDHAMRDDSAQDADFVTALARSYGLRTYVERSKRPLRSEAEARSARYEFLERIRVTARAETVITAHHQDDVIETSLLNLSRGTGRRGLSPMRSSRVLRPLLDVSRDQLRTYAETEKLAWREDASNLNEANPRNFLRRVLLPLASLEWRTNYLDSIEDLSRLNDQIDERLAAYLSKNGTSVDLNRASVRELSVSEVGELIVYTARRAYPSIELNDRLIRELAQFVQNGKTGQERPLSGKLKLIITRTKISFILNQK
jgi:tRNA(Ile)-lysidine synthetase-like protein